MTLSVPPLCLLFGWRSYALSKHCEAESFYLKTKNFKCSLQYPDSREASDHQAHLFLLFMHLPHLSLKRDAVIREEASVQSGGC